MKTFLICLLFSAFIVALFFFASSCTSYHIMAVQDYKKVNGKWVKYGQPRAMPDTLTTVHAFVWIKGKQVYPY